tara:strand:- start:67988 stop:69499 length:1512 start_codon:yes stop_codon:yes gene_type:complete
LAIKTEYKILARKYRPKSFNELVGQDSIKMTLANSLNSGRINQAYLFTGIRGVGKTTTARILARTLNYTMDNINYDPKIEIKESGLNCDAILHSRHPDVFEMDAASNTGIDHVREIINFAQTKPTLAKYKIFIIDEVHMLSKQAFNGLLKILEEPPDHVIFIFATTEIEKIPVTILSRCQKFNLNRIESSVMGKYLAEVAKEETVKIDSASIKIICNASEGSLRDALSILDQAISMCSGDIKEKKIKVMLNLNDMNFIIELFNKLINSDSISVTEEFTNIHKNGFDPLSLIRDLSKITHTATLLKIKAPITSEYLSNDQIAKIEDIILSVDIASLIHMWQMLLKGHNEILISFEPSLALEMILIKLCFSNQLPPIDSVISKIENSMEIKKSGVSTQREKIQKTFKIPQNYDEAKSMLIDNDLRLASEIDKLDLVEYKIGNIDLTSNDLIDSKTIESMQTALNDLTRIKWDINVITNKTLENNDITIDKIKDHFPKAEVINKDK